MSSKRNRNTASQYRARRSRSSTRASEKRAAWTSQSNSGPIQFEESSGNVFLDIGFPPEEAAMLLAKSGLILALEMIIEERKLSQRRLATLLRTDQPKLSKLLSGRSMGVSIDLLIKWLHLLGHSVELSVRPAAIAKA